MSYCSRSCRRRFTVLNFKSWAFSRICSHCQQQFNGHAQKRLFRNSGISFGDLATFPLIFFAFYMLNVIRFPDPDLQSAKFRRFGNVFHWFLHYKYFYFRFILPTAPGLKLIWPSTAELLRSCCWYVAWLCGLDWLRRRLRVVYSRAVQC